MTVSKWKIAMALVVAVGLLAAGAGLVTHQALAHKPGRDGATQGDPKPKAPPVSSSKEKSAPAPRDAQGQMTVTGKVVDADGKAAALAPVAVVGWEKYRRRAPFRPSDAKTLGQGKTDREGRFRLVVPRTSTERFYNAYVLASSPGHGLGAMEFDADARQPDVTVRLTRDQPLRGRLVDLQGNPAANVQVHVVRLNWVIGKNKSAYLQFRDPPEGLVTWPKAPVTDKDGRYSIAGLPADVILQIQIRDVRYARQSLEINRFKKQVKEAPLALAPAYILQGTVTFGDTGKPVPNARLLISGESGQFPRRMETMDSRTDANGRFKVSAPVGNEYQVIAYPPNGTPYLLQRKEFTRAKPDVIKPEMRIVLPRGVLVRGQVTEKLSSKPVAGAVVHFEANRDNNPYFREDTRAFMTGWEQLVTSNAKGQFAIAVLPGPGHLTINGPTNDYLHVEIGTKKLAGQQVNPEWRNYFDGLVALNLKPQASPHEVKATLRRGVTLKGKVVDPDGKAVARALLVCRSYLPSGTMLNPVYPKEIKDGRFELPGCDPEKTSEVFFCDAKHQLATVANLSGKLAGKDITVKLQRCGQATARLVDKDGKPVKGVRVHIEFVITPGIPFVDSFKRKGPVADVGYMSQLDHEGHSWDKVRSDAKGKIFVPTLIPGATYWMIGSRLTNNGIYNLNKEFKVEPGQKLDLGDIVVETGNN